jgi:3-hydroxybutyrate dehydrogenase
MIISGQPSQIPRTALVTGSIQGIGLAIARSFAKAGYKLGIHGLATRDEGHAVAAQLMAEGAPEARFFDGDLCDPDAIAEMMKEVQAWSAIDILVNNAGIQRTASIANITPDVWNSILAVNLTAAFFTMQQALPDMAKRGYGRVINIASVHGLVGSRDKAPYVAAKHGLIGLSKVAALEYASSGNSTTGGVTVNCICPGWTETAIIQPQIEDRSASLDVDRDGAIASLLADKQPTQRMSDPSEIGELALWLCSPIAHNITGAALPVDGGWTAQ